jgi:hypothetical protein
MRFRLGVQQRARGSFTASPADPCGPTDLSLRLYQHLPPALAQPRRFVGSAGPSASWWSLAVRPAGRPGTVAGARRPAAVGPLTGPGVRPQGGGWTPPATGLGAAQVGLDAGSRQRHARIHGLHDDGGGGAG